VGGQTPDPIGGSRRRRDMYRRLLIAALPLLPVILAGCGKGGGY
jgi:hypothetical protein